MKIDLAMLEALVASGATGAIVLAAVRIEYERHEAKRAKRRPLEKGAKRRARGGPKADKGGHRVDTGRTATESERQEATLSDTPRARLFREGKPALLTMNIAPSRAGALITEWLKLTNDDDQLVLATILKAQGLAVADAVSWILATLKGRITRASGAPRPGSKEDSRERTIAALNALDPFDGTYDARGSEIHGGPILEIVPNAKSQ